MSGVTSEADMGAESSPWIHTGAHTGQPFVTANDHGSPSAVCSATCSRLGDCTECKAILLEWTGALKIREVVKKAALSCLWFSRIGLSPSHADSIRVRVTFACQVLH